MKRLLLITIMAFLLVGCAKADANGTETQKPNSNETESESISTEDMGNTEIVDSESEEVVQNPYTFTEMNTFMYAKSVVNVRDLPCADGNKIGELTKGQEVNVGGQCNETGWYRIGYNGVVAYVSSDYLVDTKPDKPQPDDPKQDDPVGPSEPNDPVDPSKPIPDEIVTYGQWRFNRAELGAMEADIARLAQGGLNGMVSDYTTRQGCAILITSLDNATVNAAVEKLSAHINSLGYEMGSWSPGPLHGCLDDGIYMVQCCDYQPLQEDDEEYEWLD